MMSRYKVTEAQMYWSRSKPAYQEDAAVGCTFSRNSRWYSFAVQVLKLLVTTTSLLRQPVLTSKSSYVSESFSKLGHGIPGFMAFMAKPCTYDTRQSGICACSSKTKMSINTAEHAKARLNLNARQVMVRFGRHRITHSWAEHLR